MVFGLFNKEKALKKTIERANNPLAQSADRWAAMEKLRDEASPEALEGLCRRFSISASKIIEDQQEKDWVVSTLVGLGEASIPPLRRYMKNAKSLGYPLQILGKVASEGAMWEAIDALLEDEEPGYVRDPKKRTDIIEWLGERDCDHKDIVARVLPYVEDFDENVRFKTVETISQKPHESAAETIARAMVRDDEESQRFQVRCAEVLAENDWPLTPHEEAAKALTSGALSKFRVEGSKIKTA